MIIQNVQSLMPFLLAEGRSHEVPEEDDLYGWFTGEWELDLAIYDSQRNIHKSRGEACASWVLEGRMIQDVFINPERSQRKTSLHKWDGNWYGTTLRVYDPRLRAWHITWINPVNGSGARLIGKRKGKDVVQEGHYSDGGKIRWSFSKITPDSFHWSGERWTEKDGWMLEAEFEGKRIK